MNNDSMLLAIIGVIIWSCLQGIFLSKRLDIIIDLIKDLQPKTPEGLKVSFYIEGKEVDHMDMQIGKKKKVSVKFKDAAGFEAKVDGKPVFAVSDLEVASMVVSEDGLSAEVMALKPGSFMLSLTADADLGSGVKPILGSLAFDVLAGEAVSVELVAEDVVEAPAPSEPAPEAPPVESAPQA